MLLEIGPALCFVASLNIGITLGKRFPFAHA
jgi:hypothetical protein